MTDAQKNLGGSGGSPTYKPAGERKTRDRTANTASHVEHALLVHRAALAIIREWSNWGDMTEAEALAAVERNFAFRQRFGPELADVRANADWDDACHIPTPRAEIDLRETVVDLTAPIRTPADG